MRILIAGAGIGGLALAHALQQDGGVDVAVFERDPSPNTRHQGYRLHLDPNGNAALRACLPPHVLDRVRDTSGVNGDLVASYTSRLQQVMAQEFPGITDEMITNVDRETFRRGLLTDAVVFGRTVTSYAVTEEGRVRVAFAEGGTDEGDLLVGADGVGSAIRRQLVPHAVLRDLGIRCLYGRMPIDATTELPADFARGFCWVSGDNGFGAGFAPVRFRERPAGATDYLMTALVASAELLGRADESPAAEKSATEKPAEPRKPAELWKIAVDATADWHPAVRALFANADPESFFPITIRAGERVEAWQPGPVTLLGDAIHTMPPAGGVGANTALQDAATLSAELLSCVREKQSLIDAVAAYERVMLPRGFDTVESSVRMIGHMVPRAA